MVLIVFLPLIFFFGFQNPYEYPKFFLFVAVSFLLFAFYALGIIRLQLPLPAFDLTIKILILFSAWYFFVDLYGIDPKTSLLGSAIRYQGFLTTISGVLLFFVTRFVLQREKKQMVIILRTFFISTTILIAVAIFQKLSMFLYPQLWVPTFQGRILATMGNPNFLGGYLAVGFPLVWWYLLKKKQSRLAFFMFLCNLIVIFWTGSQSAILGFFLGVSLMTINKYKRIPPQVFFGLCLFFSIGIIGGGILNPSYTLSGRSSSWDNRAIIWQSAISGISKRPLVGYGQENFLLVFPKERHMVVDNAHNIFLETAISSGIIGLSLFLTILFIVLKNANTQIKISLIVFVVVASFNPLSITQIMQFWILCGMALKDS
ncbi:MAG: O-antigen ligase family protein [Candidatus Levybacteria bacterium]|nr:O-antigen ligase family protein [Candidatus Levybacteria bacterium]